MLRNTDTRALPKRSYFECRSFNRDAASCNCAAGSGQSGKAATRHLENTSIPSSTLDQRENLKPQGTRCPENVVLKLIVSYPPSNLQASDRILRSCNISLDESGFPKIAAAFFASGAAPHEQQPELAFLFLAPSMTPAVGTHMRSVRAWS